MEITALSGATVTHLHEEEWGCMVESGKHVRDLKKLLASRIGYSRFRQRFLSEDMGELPDDMLLIQMPSVQLVVLDFCAPEETIWEDLLLACENNRVVEVTQLLQKPLDPNARGDIDIEPPPLLLAADRGHLKVIQLLLEAGADTNAIDENLATASMAASHNGHLEVVRLLLEAGADTNATDYSHSEATALMAAAHNGHLEVVRLLR